MRFILAIPLVLLAAGCLGEPAPAEEPPEGPADVPVRTLAVGAHSEIHEPFRLVFTDEAAFAEFWRMHHQRLLGPDGEAVAPPPPEVNFSEERVVAVGIGDRPNGCWAVRVTNATRDEGTTTLNVTTYEPGPASICTAVITQPWAMVAIPADGTEVAWREETVTGAPFEPPGPEG